jgi:tetratricopeptide (TPR) repeat protein
MIFYRSKVYVLLVFQLFLFFLDGSADTTDTASKLKRLSSADPVERLKAMEEMTGQYFYSNMTMALSYAKKELKLATGIGNLEYQNRACIRLGMIFSSQAHFDSALFYLKKSVEGTKKTGDKKRLCTSYALLGQICFNQEERLEALRYLKLAVATDSINSTDLIDVYAKLGIITGDAGNITRAMEFFNKALKLSKSKSDSDETAYIYSSIAGIFSRISNMEKCIEYNAKALDIFTRSKNLRGQAYILNDLGMTYFELNKYRKALECYEQSLAKRDRKNDLQGIAFTLTNIGDAFLQLGQPDSALHYYETSLKYSAENGDKLSKSCTYLSLGKFYLARKNFSKALYFLDLGLQLSLDLNYRANLEETYLLLSETYNEIGHPDESLAFLKMRNAVRDSSLHLKAQAVVTEMMIKYETGERKEEISKLNNEVNEKNRRIRNVFLVLSGLFILISVSFAIIYYYYRKNVQPKVRSLDNIRNKLSEITEKDDRRMKSLKKMLPSEFETAGQKETPATEIPLSLISDLENLMARDKVYLNENLAMADVALMLKTNTSYLSRLINDHYGQNFNLYINKYRIEEAKDLMKKNQHEKLSYEGIARSVGFRSRSSFNQAFKTFTNMTPSEYVASFRSFS